MALKNYRIEVEISFDDELNEKNILEKVENDLWLLEDESRVIEVSVDNIRCYPSN